MKGVGVFIYIVGMMKINKRKFQAVGSVVLFVALLGFAIWGFFKFNEFQDQARAMESVMLLRALQAGTEASLLEYKKYPEKFENFGFVPEKQLHSHVFTTLESVPQVYQSLLAENMKPFVNETNYRFLAILHTNNRIYFNSIDKYKTLQAQVVEISEKDRSLYNLPTAYTFDPQRKFR